MSLEVDIETKGDEQAARLLSGMAQRGQDPRPALRRIIEELRLAEDPWFATHGGGAWVPLADVTRADKERHGYPSDPLVRTGFLGASLTTRHGSRSIRTVTKEELHFGTRVFYAKFHAMGAAPVPVRNPLVPTDVRTRRRMVFDVKRYLLTGETVGGFFVA